MCICGGVVEAAVVVAVTGGGLAAVRRLRKRTPQQQTHESLKAAQAEACRKAPGPCTCGMHRTELGEWPRASTDR